MPTKKAGRVEWLTAELLRLTPGEAGELRKAVEARWQVDAAGGRSDWVIIADPPMGCEVEPPRVDLILTDAGRNPLAVAKQVHQLLDIGILAARELVAALPLTLARNLGSHDAWSIRRRIEWEGGTVVEQPVNPHG